MDFLSFLDNMDKYLGFINRLANQLKLDLPGSAAHLKMASRIRVEELMHSYDVSLAKPSSVLILLYQKEDSVYTVLMKRQTYDGVHSGQVSFPGGKKENNDFDLKETALREAHEEVGIITEDVKVIGSLSDLYIPPSNFIVTPYIGFQNSVPRLTPEKSEVAEILEVNLADLFRKDLVGVKEIVVRGSQITAPYYSLNGHTVWGATAMILSELAEIIKSID